MSNLFGVAKAGFDIVGEVTEERILRSTKESAKDWKQPVCKVVTAGSTLEVQLTEEQHSQVLVGNAYQFVGRIAKEGGRINLVVEELRKLATPKAS